MGVYFVVDEKGGKLWSLCFVFVLKIVLEVLVFLGSCYSSLYNMYQIYLLDVTVAFILSIMVFVLGLLVVVVVGGVYVKFYDFNFKVLEFFLRVVPIMILVCLALVSFHLLYYDGLVINGGKFGDVLFGPVLDVKVVGHQWF